ncbi:MAG: Uma2 family endonuclease [Planctomycetaceae bacterium]|nr:Uma2 family endonuclease [Planctomycetaceae bacterium]
MSTSALKRYTVNEYLALERASDVKHEFFDGEIFAMAGGSRAHNLISLNIASELRNALEDSPCEVYPRDMRVKLPTGLYTYPDVSVVCSEARFEGEGQDVLLNPLLIVEVLSPSTEAYDRGTKFEHYGQLPSLREYVLVSQDRVNVEHFVRADAQSPWVLTRSTVSETKAFFSSIERTLALAGIYAKVEIDTSASAAAPPRHDSGVPR